MMNALWSPLNPHHRHVAYTNLINYYYATMGYPVVSTWCKAIDKDYFRGWNGLISKRVLHFIKPSEHNLMGHLDQR
ncbi:hypothetical protein ACHAW6_010287 [Cyclotella cf. meneghiniana]